MKIIHISLCFLLALFSFSCKEKNESDTLALTKKINQNWKFIQSNVPESIENNFNDSKWETVQLPHDWSISKPFSKDNPSFSRGAWLPAGISFYRKKIDLSDIGKNQKVFIHFEGAYRNSAVWINGHHLGKRPMGYIGFEYELTPHITHDDKNMLVVKLDNSAQPGSRWYSGNGIYRDVFLKVKNEVHLSNWGTQVTTPNVTANEAVVQVNAEINNTSSERSEIIFKISINDNQNNNVSTKIKKLVLNPNATSNIELTTDVKNPKLWDIDQPNLYQVKVEILDGETIVDSEEISTGFRTLEYTVDNGFVLNDKPLKIHGVCVHHGAGPLGAAARSTSYERQIRILKEMGTNAIRTAHNPFDPEFLDACDRLGMLVMNEIFDEWEVQKKPMTFREKGNKIRIPVTYYYDQFKEWSDKDLTDFVKRDRNHPSIFMWSIGNEIDQMHEEEGVEIAKRLSEIVHHLDSRPVTCGVNGYGWGKWPHEPAVAQIDIPGYNYAWGENYDKEHQNFPNRKMIATEHTSAQAITNRGEYYPFKNESATYQMDLPIEHSDTKKFLDNRLSYEKGKEAWLAVKERPYILGHFIWTGWDYLGEVIPYSWPARSSSFGVVDLAGFPKDGFYYYQSQWTEVPMIHVFPHWNWEGHEGKSIDIQVFTNVDQVELLVNGKSLGRQDNNPNGVKTLTYKTTYTAGELKAIGYKNGKPIVEKVISTAGKTNQLDLKVADKSEIIYVEVTALDKDKNFNPIADELVNFEVENAEILGVGNGNNKSHEPFVVPYRKLYHGKCIVILRKKNELKPASLMAKIKNGNTAKASF